MQNITTNTTRSIVTTTRGEVLPIKEHRGWRYINYNGRKIGVNTIPVLQKDGDSNDPLTDYVFKGWYTTHPCAAMEYFFYRYRVGHKVSANQYKSQFKINIKCR